MGCLYKIILKVLANKIKPVLGEVISENQTGFIQARYIADGILTINESVYWLKRKKKLDAIFKVNFKKAYDTLRWSLIDHMQEQIG